MSKDRVLNIRTYNDLVEKALEVTGEDITNTIEVALRELIMNRRPKMECLIEERRLLEERLKIVKKEIESIAETVDEKKVKPESDLTKSLADRLEVVWDIIEARIKKEGITHLLSNPDFIIFYTQKLKAVNQQELKDAIKSRYERK